MKSILLKTCKGCSGLLGLIFIVFGCNIDDIPDLNNVYLPNYEGEVAIVLVKDTLNMQEFLDNTISDTNSILNGPNQEVIFQYETTTDYEVGDNFVEVQSFSNSEFIESPIPFAFVTPKDTTLAIDEELVFDFPSNNKEELDSVFYNGGELSLVVESGFPGELDYTFTVNSFVNVSSDMSIFLSATLPATNTTTSDTQTEPLSGYKTNLSRKGDSNVFVANVHIEIRIPQGTTLDGTEDVSFNLGVNNPEFETIFGFFGQDTIDITPRRISLGIFQDFTGSGIDFESPNISLEINNSFGIPVSLDFSKVFAEYDDQPNLFLSGQVADVPQTILAPTPAEYLDPIKASTITISPDNSNIRELLSSTPERLVFPLTGYSNMGTTDQNFISSTAKIDIRAVMQLPLSLSLQDFEYEEEIELGDVSQLSQTESLSLLFYTINELPFDGEVDIYFNDANGNVLDSVVSSVLFVAPTSYDAVTGKVTEPSINSTSIDLDASKIDALVTASTLTLVTRLNSYGNTDGEFVRLFSDYSLLTSVSVLGKVSVDLNDN